MDLWNKLTAGFGSHADLLGFASTARPTADEWLAAFTGNFMQHPDATHGTQALMSGLRFYTPEFMAAVTAIPPVATRKPLLAGNIPQAIYTATGPIIATVYQNLISRNAARSEIQAAFTQAMPSLLAQYNHTSYSSNGVGYQRSQPQSASAPAPASAYPRPHCGWRPPGRRARWSACSGTLQKWKLSPSRPMGRRSRSSRPVWGRPWRSSTPGRRVWTGWR